MAREVVLVLKHSTRAMVEKLDLVTSPGFLDGGDARERLGVPGRGPQMVITDLGVMRPDPETRELTLTSVHPGVGVGDVRAATGWTRLRCSSRAKTR